MLQAVGDRGVAHQRRAVGPEGDDGRRHAPPLFVGHDDGRAVAHDRDGGRGGAQVDAAARGELVGSRGDGGAGGRDDATGAPSRLRYPGPGRPRHDKHSSDSQFLGALRVLWRRRRHRRIKHRPPGATRLHVRPFCKRVERNCKACSLQRSAFLFGPTFSFPSA